MNEFTALSVTFSLLMGTYIQARQSCSRMYELTTSTKGHSAQAASVDIKTFLPRNAEYGLIGGTTIITGEFAEHLQVLGLLAQLL